MKHVKRKATNMKMILLMLALLFSVFAVRLISHECANASISVELSEKYYIEVYNKDTATIMDLPLEEYVIGVVCAEMPASFSIEALKAQAVAARTFAVCRMDAVSGDAAEKCKTYGTDICTDSACCQAWSDTETQKEQWGEDYSRYIARITECVMSTKGMIAVYDELPISALFHASSGGETEDCENVFSAQVPYLRSVESPDSTENSGYYDEVRMQAEELYDMLNDKLPNAHVKVLSDIVICERSGSGRVLTIKVGNMTMTGREFRKALSLKSAYFWLENSESEVVIKTLGYGHGVGMSQSGANEMAKLGALFGEILEHYYSGIAIKQI